MVTFNRYTFNSDGEQVDVEEISVPDAVHNAQMEAARREAYIMEADPLFFKYQRDETTKQEWLDKIEEIKSRFPSI